VTRCRDMAIPNFLRCEVGRRSVASHRLKGSSNPVLTTAILRHSRSRVLESVERRKGNKYNTGLIC